MKSILTRILIVAVMGISLALPISPAGAAPSLDNLDERIFELERQMRTVSDLLKGYRHALSLTAADVSTLKSLAAASGKQSSVPALSLTEKEVATLKRLAAASGKEPPPLSEVVEKARQSVVTLIVKKKDGKFSTGSGVVAWKSPDKKEIQIHTNKHVVADYQEITVIVFDGRVYTGQYWSHDADLDYATVQVEGTGLPEPISWGDSKTVKVGDQVIVIGNPLGYRDTVSIGILSGRVGSLDNSGYKFLQTDAAVNPGNSGGPLLDRHGQYIGLVTSKISAQGVEGLGFVTSLESIRTSISINRRDNNSRSYFGAIFSEGLAASLGAFSESGVSLTRVDGSGPLGKAGFLIGDEIMKIDDKTISNLTHLREVVDTVLPGTKVFVTYKRGGLVRELPLIMGKVTVWEQKPIMKLVYNRLEIWEAPF